MLENNQPNQLINSNDCFDATVSEVACQGEGDVIGHPLVYLSVENKSKVVCPYCSKEFTRTR